VRTGDYAWAYFGKRSGDKERISNNIEAAYSTIPGGYKSV
jgi:hypothetical protein